MLNQPTPDDLFDFSQETDVAQQDIDAEEITVEEVSRVIHRLKNNRASGLDDISAELLNDVIATELTYLFNLMNKNEDDPDEWRHGIIVTLLKK